MEDLIKAIKAAPAPSRELDHQIDKAVRGMAAPVPAYTLYLDHALKLMPEPSDNWSINTEPCGYYACISTVRHKKVYDEMVESMWDVQSHGGQVIEKGATPAMAFCIAALGARAYLQSHT